MIVKKSFFKNEIYIPHAKSSITDDVLDVESKVTDFINHYEKEALEKCLGKLSIEFFSNIDSQEPTLIKSGSDVKWDWLMNGHTYTLNDGTGCTWNGIRRYRGALGEDDSSKDANYSFLAEYIYFNYESNDFIKRADAGNIKNKSANAYAAEPNWKVVNAWNRFVDAVQGCSVETAGVKRGFLGGLYVDYRGNDRSYDVSLYQFINDMNSIDPDTYKNFNPKKWGRINKMGI